jgi:hypothetical protein
MITILGFVPPFTDLTANRLEIINEVFVLLTNYHLMMFTDFLSDLLMREHVGMSLVVTTILGVVVNLSVVILETASILVKIMKRSYLKWNHSRAVREIRTRKEAERNKLLAEQAF